MSDERREFQRLRLDEPLDGWFGDYAVRLMNISATGALVYCDDDIPANARALLRFFWRGHEVELIAEISRRGEDGDGLAFIEDATPLRALLAESVNELLRAQEANAVGNRAQNVYGDATLTSASSHATSTFVTWTFDDNGWSSRESLLRDQPPNGFTVYAGEPDEQVALLRRTWEVGDTESRKLTRMLAELSVTSRTGSAR